MTPSFPTPEDANGPTDQAEERAALITAYALGQLPPDEAVRLEQADDFSPEEAARIRRLANQVAAVEQAGGSRSPALRDKLEKQFAAPVTLPPRTGSGRRRVLIGAASLALLTAGLPLCWWSVAVLRQKAERAEVAVNAPEDIAFTGGTTVQLPGFSNESLTAEEPVRVQDNLDSAMAEVLRSKVKGSSLTGHSLVLDLYGSNGTPASGFNRPTSDTRYSGGTITGLGIEGRGRAEQYWYAAPPGIVNNNTRWALDNSDSMALDLGRDLEPRDNLQAPGGGEAGPGHEGYAPLVDNPFAPVWGGRAVSTFSIDVDTASYSNVRRMLRDGYWPPADAVRIEEMINYFHYDYRQPEQGPVTAQLDLAACPWAPGHQLLRVALKGKEVEQKERPPCNLVFLLDVSGSMNSADKLPLLQESMKLLTAQLDKGDRVAIVTYAGREALHLDTTFGDQQIAIRDAISALGAGGSTNGSAGITLAYQKARANFDKNRVNRVILATDGDLNVGVTDTAELKQLIAKEAASGVFLTVLGFGKGNLQDELLEQLADHGNGVYAYIDSVREGRKVLAEQATSTLVTIAKDVKLQLEFNPRRVGAYRLIGYANRMLQTADFANDKKDAGDLGAGHTVTAFYELIPPPLDDAPPEPETPLGEGEWKYQAPAGLQSRQTPAAQTDEWVTASLRYKEPQATESQRLEFVLRDPPVAFAKASVDFQFAAAVAAWGMQLRQSPYRGDFTLADVKKIAADVIKLEAGDRAEFLELLERSEQLRAGDGK
ncbi:YfbK domain-containing protein [Lignipirellula cremea]|uniref:von Willebrand factor n=1 Tax=Lignipirellula cremea TaxID=2528010 RepID=A0A518DLI9_9BACT|nr:von Willebrand factor type A domain-containing protein [Lignipirellula cremea]QDU92691.1 von Willebrand factor [Lignipirellula cremea]